MTKHSSFSPRDIITTTLRVFVCFSLLRICASYSDIDLSLPLLDHLTTGLIIKGSAASDSFGWSVSSAGDINSDEYDDVIIGAPNKNSNRGAVYVIYGGENSSMMNLDLSTTPLDPLTTEFTITGNAVGGYFGRPVSTAGDINKGGLDDIIVGAYGRNSNQGAVYLIYAGIIFF